MTRDLKERIDAIWINSDYGDLCRAIADDDIQKADNIRDKIFNDGYIMIEVLEDELAAKIAQLLHEKREVEEYLKLLEKENFDLVGVLIKQELLWKIENYLVR